MRYAFRYRPASAKGTTFMDLPAAADIDIEPSGEWTIGAIRINDSPLWMPSPLYEAATDYVLSQHGRDIDRAVRRSLGSAAI